VSVAAQREPSHQRNNETRLDASSTTLQPTGWHRRHVANIRRVSCLGARCRCWSTRTGGPTRRHPSGCCRQRHRNRSSPRWSSVRREPVTEPTDQIRRTAGLRGVSWTRSAVRHECAVTYVSRLAGYECNRTFVVGSGLKIPTGEHQGLRELGHVPRMAGPRPTNAGQMSLRRGLSIPQSTARVAIPTMTTNDQPTTIIEPVGSRLTEEGCAYDERCSIHLFQIFPHRLLETPQGQVDVRPLHSSRLELQAIRT
jgi:hypothetical protein